MLSHSGQLVRVLAGIGLGMSGAAALGQSAASEGPSSQQEVLQSQQERIERLENRISRLEAELARLQESMDSSPGTAPGAASAADGEVAEAETADEASAPAIEWKGAPELTSADGEYSIKLRGRMMADAWSVTDDPEDRNYPSGTELRSVRLGVQGDLGPALSYVAEVDFAGNDVVVKSAYLQYQGSPAWALQAGNMKPHVSLENRTSRTRIMFMERSLPNVFAISDEVLAVAFETNGHNWSLGAGGFGEGPGTAIEGNEGYGIAARFTHAPLLDEDRVLHLGVSGYHKHLGSDAGADFRVRQRPESHLFGTRLLDTGTIPADSSSVLGVELAGAMGPFLMQAEYLRNRVDLIDAGTSDFDGAYAWLSWIATGESRGYSNSSGTFGAVTPDRPLGRGGWGALEWALRYSTVDLNDGLLFGGKEQNITLGANWYLSEHARVMFNWVHFDVDRSAATLPFGLASHEGDAFGIRAQLTW